MAPLLKNLKFEASEALRLAEAHVLHVLEALGGTFVCVQRVVEALGGSSVRILRVLEALGGSFVRVLRVLEGSGAPQACFGGPGSSRSHDPSALSVFGGHDPSKSQVLEGSEAPSSIHSALLKPPRRSRARSTILRPT